MRSLVPLLAMGVLAGCAAMPEASLQTRAPFVSALQNELFQLAGRVGVKYDDQGFSGNMRWQHRAQSDEILILSPLGQGVAQIVQDSTGVSLTTSDQKIYHAQDAETLTDEILGWRLPLAGLRYWVVGRAAPGNAEMEHDQAGRVSRLKQDGWQIDYLSYRETNGVTLPQKLIMQRGNLEMKLIIDSWDSAQTDM